MCTALSMYTDAHYFGRNLDLERSYGEEVCITPRRAPLTFRKMGELCKHYAFIGMATVVDGTPLYYDAANEHGVAMAELNFPHNAHYPALKAGKDNITPFECIPWVLAQCKTLDDVKVLLQNINLVNIPFSDTLPLSPLHWMIADKNDAIVVESMQDGLHVYDNPVRVMTNNPPFPMQLFNLNNYRHLQVTNGENHFAKNLDLATYCTGLGGIGLPGDMSSMSRFVRMAFLSQNSVCDRNELSAVSQFFHLLSAVEMTRGGCQTDDGQWDITVYSSCIHADSGRYYYTTYDNRQITCVDMYNTDIESDTVSRYPLITAPQIVTQNTVQKDRI